MCKLALYQDILSDISDIISEWNDISFKYEFDFQTSDST